MDNKLLDTIGAQFTEAMDAIDPNWKSRSFLVAFSGGADSLALLDLLRSHLDPGQILAACLDHGIREDSKEQTERALKLAFELDVEAISSRIDVPHLAHVRKLGLEEAGRVARYGFLEEIRAQRGLDYIVTGHQGSDVAETIIYKLSKGAGPGALAGIRAKGKGTLASFIRPLLSFSAQEIRKYLSLRGLTYLEDETNRDLKYGRNQVRHKVMKNLEGINPRYVEAFLRASTLAQGEEDLWEWRLAELMEQMVLARTHAAGSYFLLEEEKFLLLHLAEKRRLVGKLLRDVTIKGIINSPFSSLKGAELALGFIDLKKKGGLDLPGGRRIARRGVTLSIGPASRYLLASCQKGSAL